MLLFAATLPLPGRLHGVRRPQPAAALQLMIMLITTTWCFQGLSMLNGLISKSKNPPAR